MEGGQAPSTFSRAQGESPLLSCVALSALNSLRIGLTWEQRTADAIKLAELKTTNKQEPPNSSRSRPHSRNRNWKKPPKFTGGCMRVSAATHYIHDVAALEVKPCGGCEFLAVGEAGQAQTSALLRHRQKMTGRTAERTGLNPMLPTLLDE